MAQQSAQDYTYPAPASQGVLVDQLPTVLADTAFSVAIREDNPRIKLQPRLPTIRVDGRLLYLASPDRKTLTFLVDKNAAKKIQDSITENVKPVISDAIQKAGPISATKPEEAPAQITGKKRKVLKPVQIVDGAPTATEPNFKLEIVDDQHDTAMSRIYVRYSAKNLKVVEVKGDSYETINPALLEAADFKAQDGHPLRYRECEIVLSPSEWIAQDHSSYGFTFFINSLVIGPQNEFLEQALGERYKVQAPSVTWKGRELSPSAPATV